MVLTNLLGGSLSLTSKRGNGMTFSLWLPLQLR
jgi:signal transduction histidine kinase